MAPFSSSIGDGYATRQQAERGQVLAGTIREVLVASGALALGDLCVEPFKAVWALGLELTVLDDDGNLMDACVAAAVATLAATRLPATVTDDHGRVRLVRQGAGHTHNLHHRRNFARVSQRTSRPCPLMTSFDPFDRPGSSLTSVCRYRSPGGQGSAPAAPHLDVDHLQHLVRSTPAGGARCCSPRVRELLVVPPGRAPARRRGTRPEQGRGGRHGDVRHSRG